MNIHAYEPPKRMPGNLDIYWLLDALESEKHTDFFLIAVEGSSARFGVCAWWSGGLKALWVKEEKDETISTRQALIAVTKTEACLWWDLDEGADLGPDDVPDMSYQGENALKCMLQDLIDEEVEDYFDKLDHESTMRSINAAMNDDLARGLKR